MKVKSDFEITVFFLCSNRNFPAASGVSSVSV